MTEIMKSRNKTMDKKAKEINYSEQLGVEALEDDSSQISQISNRVSKQGIAAAKRLLR